MDNKNKRKVTFAEVDEENKRQKNTTNDTRLHTGKYTLDSDEEDDDEQRNNKQTNQYDLDEIGQERATIGFDNDVKITPFNIDEELEEGHYDETGCFQWKKKDKDEVHDAWLDEIDWTNVKNYKLKNPEATGDGLDDPDKSNTSNDDGTDRIQFNEVKTLKSMLAIMQPGETVARTIKRFGTMASNSKPKQLGKQRKLLPGQIQTSSTIEKTPEELKKNKIILEEMSGLADQFVSNGDLDIYQETYERLQSKLDRLEMSTKSRITTMDSTFDMYGDSEISSSINKPTSSSTETASSSKILWEYTTKENTSDNIQGPFTTEHMIRLTNIEGKLDKDNTKCRRVGTEQFYSLKRIDFDLYLD